MVIKFTEWIYNIPTSSIVRPSKIYPNLDFLFENIPSGNPESNHDECGEIALAAG
jgi:hypothetical protein